MIPIPIENSHARLERSFADAILSDDAAIPASVQLASGPATTSRFGVYRNNVMASLLNVLASRYPVARKILWPDTFDGAARLFVTLQPPRSPVLLHYGEGLPQFLRTIGRGAAAEYAADIAELEAARTRAYHATDAMPLPGEAFARLSPDLLSNLRLKLHPSITLLRSRFPVVSVWEASQTNMDVGVWKEEAALIARPHLEVEVWRLPPGGYEFFSALVEGKAIGSAIEGAIAVAADFDLAASFRILIGAGVVSILETFDRPR
jgi:hypothetical protein